VAYSTRDPLSARYDVAAAKFVTRVLAAWDGRRNGGWVETTVVPLSQRMTAWAVARGIDPGMIRYTGRGSGIETLNEAAFRRAVYWDDRVYLWARPFEKVGGERARNPARVAALEFEWGRRTVAGRVARARAHPIVSASRWAERGDPYDRAG
jgi:hypothetical protein